MCIYRWLSSHKQLASRRRNIRTANRFACIIRSGTSHGCQQLHAVIARLALGVEAENIPDAALP